MLSQYDKYDRVIANDIIAKGRGDVTEVNNLVCAKELDWTEQNYHAITNTFNTNKIPDFSLYPNADGDGFATLSVYRFENQFKNRCYAIVYDSLALEQNPEVINMYMNRQ